MKRFWQIAREALIIKAISTPLLVLAVALAIVFKLDGIVFFGMCVLIPFFSVPLGLMLAKRK